MVSVFFDSRDILLSCAVSSERPACITVALILNADQLYSENTQTMEEVELNVILDGSGSLIILWLASISSNFLDSCLYLCHP